MVSDVEGYDHDRAKRGRISLHQQREQRAGECVDGGCEGVLVF